MIALVALACAPAQAAKRCPGADDVPFPQVSDADIAALQCVVNRERERRGLRELDRTRSLDRAAARHSSDMARNDYFDHRSPGGSTPAARARSAGYLQRRALLARRREPRLGDRRRSRRPTASSRRGSKSPPHRELMLSRGFADFGLGIASGAPQAGVSGRRDLHDADGTEERMTLLLAGAGAWLALLTLFCCVLVAAGRADRDLERSRPPVRGRARACDCCPAALRTPRRPPPRGSRTALAGRSSRSPL